MDWLVPGLLKWLEIFAIKSKSLKSYKKKYEKEKGKEKKKYKKEKNIEI